jgi:hypothetical protein
MYYLSIIILLSSLPIIKSLRNIEQNTAKLQKDTEELVSKTKKLEKIIEILKSC